MDDLGICQIFVGQEEDDFDDVKLWWVLLGTEVRKNHFIKNFGWPSRLKFNHLQINWVQLWHGWPSLGTCQSIAGKKEVTWMTLGTSHFLLSCNHFWMTFDISLTLHDTNNLSNVLQSWISILFTILKVLEYSSRLCKENYPCHLLPRLRKAWMGLFPNWYNIGWMKLACWSNWHHIS